MPKRQCGVHTSVSLSIKKAKSRLKYRCIATSKVRNEKDKKLEKTHCEVMLFSFEGMTSKEKSGDDSKEEPPVPMPNTEVKLLNVDDTWWVTAWESRKLPERKEC